MEQEERKIPVASLRGVSFGYRSRPIFDSLDWDIGPGIGALMGPNGAGKTTLLKLLAGALKPRGGTIELRPTHDSLPPTVGYLPQRYNFVDRMRVAETAAHTAWSSGIGRAQLDDFVWSALAKVDLADQADKRVGTLSGGQRQRLAIACTLSSKPSVLLLDEPTVGLDPVQRRKLRELLRDLARTTPIILSTHLVDDVAELADQITVLDHGRLIYDGTAVGFVGGRSLEEAYVLAVSRDLQ